MDWLQVTIPDSVGGWILLVVEVVFGAIALWWFAWLVWNTPRRWRYWGDLYRRRAWWFQRLKRPDVPIRLWVGRRGRGKSLRVTFEAQKIMRKTVIRSAGCRHDDEGFVVAEWPDDSPDTIVVSNYPIRDLLTGRVALHYETLEEVIGYVANAVLLDQRVIVCTDEAQNIFDARDWEMCPRYFRQFLSESRHYKCGFLAATQDLSMVEKRFRILCDQIVRVDPMFESMQHRLALYVMSRIDQDPNKVEEERIVGVSWLSWVYGSAFVGYSTAALPSDEQVSEASNVEAIKELLAASRAFVSRFEAVGPPERSGGPEAGSGGCDEVSAGVPLSSCASLVGLSMPEPVSDRVGVLPDDAGVSDQG